MRLICPNCGAQYEVQDGVIPPEGREVQCSNCGDTWFQDSAQFEQDLAQELGQDVAAQPTPMPQHPQHPAPPQFEPEPEQPDYPAPQRPIPQDKTLSEDVKSILREEAELHQAQRTAAAPPLHAQPDLGLENAPPQQDDLQRAEEVRDRMARLRGFDTPEQQATGPTAMPTREAFQNVDNTQMSMRERYEEKQQPAPRRRSGRGAFRFGTFVTLGCALAAVVVYMFSTQISAAYPPATPYLDAFMVQANALRDTMDGLVASASQRLSALIG